MSPPNNGNDNIKSYVTSKVLVIINAMLVNVLS